MIIVPGTVNHIINDVSSEEDPGAPFPIINEFISN